MLCIGLVKFRWNAGSYISFLNTRDRNEARGNLSVAHPASFGYMFRGSGSVENTGIDILSGELLTGDLLSWANSTWLDAYDPSLEEDLTNMTGDDVDESGFGFKDASNTSTSTDTTTSSQDQLLNLIKKHELNK